MRQGTCGAFGCLHDAFDAVRAHIFRSVGDPTGLPDRKHGRIFLERSVANQKTQKKTLLERSGPAPLRPSPVVVEHDEVAGAEASCLAPAGLSAVSSQFRDSEQLVVGRQPKRVPLLCPQLEDRLAAGREEPAFRAPLLPIHARGKRPADEVGNLARSFAGVHPRVRRDARIRGKYLLAIREVVVLVDSVDEDHSGLGVIVGRPHQPLPEVARLGRAHDIAAEHQVPRLALAHRSEERVADQDREVEVPEPPRLALSRDELLDVGVVAAHGAHHRPAPRAGRHDGLAHGVPDIHEADRTGGVRPRALHRRALGPERREIVPDAAALLHRQRCFLHVLEDRAEIVLDRPHHEAVEERHPPVAAGTGDDPPGWQEAEVRDSPVEAVGPQGALALAAPLDARSSLGDAPPGSLDAVLERRAVGGLQAVLQIPYLMGDRRLFCCVPAHPTLALVTLAM